jgi:hypothetical protein
MAVPARVLAAGLAGCAVVVVLAYYGSGSSAVISRPSAEPGLAGLVRSMQSAVRGASSVRVGGQLTRNGTVLSVDLGLHRNGDMTGVIIQDGAPARIAAVAGRIYVQATPGFLRQVQAPGGSCAAACGRWIQLTLAEADRVTGDLSMMNFIGPLTSGQISMLTEGGSTTVQGQRAWVLRAADGSTLDVSAGSQHYPLEAAGGGTSPEVVRYSQWNRVPPPATPPASQILMSGGASTLVGLAVPTLTAASGT